MKNPVLPWASRPVSNRLESLGGTPEETECGAASKFVTSTRSPGWTSGLAGKNLKFFMVILSTGPEPAAPAAAVTDGPLDGAVAVASEMPRTMTATTDTAEMAAAAPPGRLAWILCSGARGPAFGSP